MNEQNQHSPEHEKPKLSAEVLLRLGGNAVSTSVEQPDFDHMVMTPEIRKAADEIIAEADAMVENPPLIDSVPGFSSVETTPAESSISYRRDVVTLPEDYKPSNPSGVWGHPSNPATALTQSYVEHLRKNS